MAMGPVLMLVFIPVAVIGLIAAYLIYFFRKEEEKRTQQHKLDQQD